MNKKLFLLLCMLVLAALAAGWFFGRSYLPLSLNKNATGEGRCLGPGEKAVYEIVQKGQPAIARVRVLDAASTTLWTRDIEISDSQESVNIILRNCHIYFSYEKNFDMKKGIPLPGFVYQIRKTDYFSEASSILLVTLSQSETGGINDRTSFYGRIYTIDPSEKYITLNQGYLGDDNYALVMKDIDTGKDAYTLRLVDLLKKYPRAGGSFSGGEWMERPDGVWLVGDIYEGPRWSAYYYIKRDTWETRIYETPEDYQAGVERSAPAFAPYLAYTNIIDWTGLPEADDALVAQQRAIRLTKKLIIADLKTGATTTIAEVPIVLHHKFRPMWLSDTTVEYTLPDGTKKQYTVHD